MGQRHMCPLLTFIVYNTMSLYCMPQILEELLLLIAKCHMTSNTQQLLILFNGRTFQSDQFKSVNCLQCKVFPTAYNVTS